MLDDVKLAGLTDAQKLAGKLTPEAWRAAADPQAFPEQVAEGLRPWQARKLYVRVGFRPDPKNPPSARVPTGIFDPLLNPFRRIRRRTLRLEPSATTLDSLRTFAYRVATAAKSDFAAAARQNGLTPEPMEPITASTFIGGFGFSQRLHDWAFAAQPGDVGGPFGNDETMLIVHVLEKQPKGLEAFETVRDRVLNAFHENRANPSATILSGAMMLRYLGEQQAAERVERAVAAVIAEGRVRTYDMGGTATTLEMGEAVARAL